MSVGSVRSSPPVMVAIAAALSMSTGASAAAADGSDVARTAGLEQVIVTGTRRAERTVLESHVPIDVVTNDDLRRTATPDLNGKLQAGNEFVEDRGYRVKAHSW
jgi:outer membrane cobalamin receptor